MIYERLCLTRHFKYAKYISVMKTYSTRQAAKLAGIHFITLHRWIGDRKIRPSISVPMDGRKLWRFTETDVEKVRQYKAAHYRKGRGRRPKK